MSEKVHMSYGENSKGPVSIKQRAVDHLSSSSSTAMRLGQGRVTKRSLQEAFQDQKSFQSAPRNDGHSSSSFARQSPRLVDFQEEGGYHNGHGVPQNGSLRSKTESIKGKLKIQAQELLPTRMSLPITAHADEIRAKLLKSNVLLLVGETGSGKSTQVPQFLVNEVWCRPKSIKLPGSPDGVAFSENERSQSKARTKIGGCIAITQPRRLAAISLASRVAAEMGTPLGSSSPASQVGYSVRFDTSVSPCTRIKFLTEGMLLQEMLRDPDLKDYSAVIVDEVHERGVNVDLILGFLRRMTTENNSDEARGGSKLKVIIMSATADMEAIDTFFSRRSPKAESTKSNDNASTIGKKYIAPRLPIAESIDSDSESSWSGLSSPSSLVEPPKREAPSKASLSPSIDKETPDVDISDVKTCHIKGRQYPVKTIYTPAPVDDILDSALKAIIHIHNHEPLPGDMLVFLTGQETVENLAALCHESYTNLIQDPKSRSSIPKLQILPLFAALPQHVQQRVFERAPPRTRKVIISTNIAETSLTVPGIRYVIDSGKCKKKQYRSRLGLDSLLVKPVSKSSANQRKGRAGREAPGTCYRLYTERDYLMLEQDNDPEILRCDLTHLVLTLKTRGVDDILNFALLTPPRRDSLERALLQLLQLQALDPQTGSITSLGRSIAHLPLSAPLGRVLLASTEPRFDCLAEAIDVISALSVENVFLNPTGEDARAEAEAARRDIYRREGDHLTLLAAVQAYVADNVDRKTWCQRHFVSHRAMLAVMDVRKQLTALFSSGQRYKWLISTPKPSLSSPSPSTEPSLPVPTPPLDPTPLPSRLLKAFLTGFQSHIAHLLPDGSYRTLAPAQGGQTVAIHPSSVLFGRRCEAIMYNEFVFTTKSYARGVSAVDIGWIGEGYS